MPRNDKPPSELDTFLDEVLYPRLFECMDTAFPEFRWKRIGTRWEATKWPPGFPFSVNHENPDRLNVYENAKYFIKIHGHSGMTPLAYLNGGSTPRGPDFLRIVEELAGKLGLQIPKRAMSPEEAERARKKEARRTALEAVYEIAHEALLGPQGEEARRYLDHKRGLNEEALKTLQFGLMPSVEELKTRLHAMGGNELLREVEEVGATWPAFEGYVAIPWRDERGGPLTIYGRWPDNRLPLMKEKRGFESRLRELPENVQDKATIPKTLALPGAGTKASPLYLDRALRAGARDLVAVEGVLDAAVLQVLGEERAVAYVAAQFGFDQVKTLARRNIRSVVVIPDPDSGGEKGGAACVKSLADNDIEAFVATIPEAMDPDEFILKHGLDAWRELVAGAISGAKYRAGLLLRDVTPESPDMKRRGALEGVFALAETFTGSSASIDRDEVLEMAGERTGYPEDALAEVQNLRLKAKAREEANRALERATREAMKAMKEGGDPFRIADSLKLNLATVRIREEEAPPPFSVARLEKESRGLLSGLSTGWQALDELDVRLHGGELAILAARTGHGKTTALVNLLDNLTEEAEDEVVLFFSLEEPEVRVFHRLLALRTAKGGRPWTVNLIRDRLLGLDGEFEDEDALNEALAHLKAKENALRIIYRPAWTPERIGAYVADVARERKVRAVLVDYLQRVRPGLEGRRRDEEVSHIARTLRAVAVDTGAPLVAGAQINREAAKRGDLDGAPWGSKAAIDALRKKRPQLHELREGGSEQEAEIVLGLHNWRADYQEDTDERTAAPGATRLEVGVLKNRYGTVGKWAPLAFEAENGLIRDPRDGREV